MKNFDWRLILVPLLITTFSLATIFSVAPEYFPKQLNFLLVALAGYVSVAVFDYRLLQKYGWPVYGVILAGLFLVLVFGEEVRGSTRWFRWGEVRLQPSEIAKILFIFFLSFIWSRCSFKLSSPLKLMVTLLLIVPVMVLVYLEPDLGTALIFGVIWLPSLLVSRVSWRKIILVTIAVLLLGIVSFQFLFQDYQKQRLLSFLDSQQDPLGSSYQMRQAIIAVGSGRLLGKGFGFGTQSHLRFLPDRHTDFIFASIAEEWGLLGSLFLLALLSLLFASILDIASKASDRFGFVFCLSSFCLLAFQALFNIGMNLGLVPVTGIPLPLVSYGGSSLVSTFLLLGMVQNIALRRKVG